jgi:hypothetical protein
MFVAGAAPVIGSCSAAGANEGLGNVTGIGAGTAIRNDIFYYFLHSFYG